FDLPPSLFECRQAFISTTVAHHGPPQVRQAVGLFRLEAGMLARPFHDQIPDANLLLRVHQHLAELLEKPVGYGSIIVEVGDNLKFLIVGLVRKVLRPFAIQQGSVAVYSVLETTSQHQTISGIAAGIPPLSTCVAGELREALQLLENGL